MMIELPDDLARFVRAEVEHGHFASAEKLIIEAVRLLRHKATAPASATVGAFTPDPLLGALRDAADELDEIVASRG